MRLAPAANPKKQAIPKHPREIDGIERPIWKVMRSVSEGELPWPLVFTGAVGTGKTSAALCLLDSAAHAIIPHVFDGEVVGQLTGEIGFYEPTAEFVSKFRRADMDELWTCNESGRLNSGGSGWKLSVKCLDLKIERSAIIVLDELGCRGQVSDHHYETVKRLIDMRAGMPLVVVSNLGPKQLGAVYDDRIVDRLWAGTVIEFTGESRR